jgi:DNA-binding MarR family transcriptional regulator
VTSDEVVLRAAAALRRGTTNLSRRLRMERPETGEPLLELSVLGHLSVRGPMTPGELAAAERVQPQTLTRTLAALEAKGQISRQTDIADRRRSLLSVTEAGRRLLLRDMRQRDSWLALAMTQNLTPTECELLRLAAGLMERLAEANVTALRVPGPLQHHQAETGPAGGSPVASDVTRTSRQGGVA